MADCQTSKNSPTQSGTAHSVVDTGAKVVGVIIMHVIPSVGWSGCLILQSFLRSETCISHNSLNVSRPMINGTVTNIAIIASVLYVTILIPVDSPQLHEPWMKLVSLWRFPWISVLLLLTTTVNTCLRRSVMFWKSVDSVWMNLYHYHKWWIYQTMNTCLIYLSNLIAWPKPKLGSMHWSLSTPMQSPYVIICGAAAIQTVSLVLLDGWRTNIGGFGSWPSCLWAVL